MIHSRTILLLALFTACGSNANETNDAGRDSNVDAAPLGDLALAAGGASCQMSLATGLDGQVGLAWREVPVGEVDERLRFALLSPSGELVAGPTTVEGLTSRAQYVELFPRATGGFFIAAGRGPRLGRITNDGELIGSPSSPSGTRGYRFAGTADGTTLHTVYVQGASTQHTSHIDDAQTETAVTEVIAGASGHLRADVATNGDTVWIAYRLSGEAYVVRTDPGGALLEAPSLVFAADNAQIDIAANEFGAIVALDDPGDSGERRQAFRTYAPNGTPTADTIVTQPLRSKSPHIDLAIDGEIAYFAFETDIEQPHVIAGLHTISLVDGSFETSTIASGDDNIACPQIAVTEAGLLTAFVADTPGPTIWVRLLPK